MSVDDDQISQLLQRRQVPHITTTIIEDAPTDTDRRFLSFCSEHHDERLENLVLFIQCLPVAFDTGTYSFMLGFACSALELSHSNF